MPIDSSGQNSMTADDAGTTLTPDDADLDVEETGGEGAAVPEPQQRTGGQGTSGQARPGRGGTSNRKDRRTAFSDQFKGVEDRLMGSVRDQLSAFKTEFSRGLEAIRAGSQPQQRQDPQQQGPDPFEARLNDIESAREAELKLLQAHDKTKGAFDFTRYRKLDSDRTALLARREAMNVLRETGITPQALQALARGQGGGRNQQVFGQEAQYAARFYRMQEEFPGIKDNAHWAQVGSYRQYLIKGEGRPDTLETDREAAAHVAARLGLGGRAAPRGNAGLYMAPGQGERGGERAPKEIRLPAGVLAALDADEKARAARDIFGGNG